MSVTFDVASLPCDGVFLFDEERVEYSECSKRHMESYMCGELAKMLDSFRALHVGANMRGPPSPMLSPQQFAQVEHFAPSSATTSNAAKSAPRQTATQGMAGAV
eukprot:261812-Pleurochrysis_carterae.AAC.1